MQKAIFINIIRLVRAVAFIVAVLTCAPANAATPKADYQFQGTYNSAVSGAPNLVNIGGGFQTETVDGSSRTVFKFAKNNGLQLSPTTPIIFNNDYYTIVLLLRFEQVSGYNRVIDFKSGDPDSGAYIQDGHLEHGVGGIAGNQWVQIVYTRAGSKGTQRGYIDGVRVLDGLSPSASDLPIGPSNTLVFFIDDGDESSMGAIARLRIYDRDLTDFEVATLDRLPGSCIPARISWVTDNHTVFSGQTANLFVGAIGTKPFVYQWYRGSSGDISFPIFGATSDTLRTPEIIVAENFWVRVSNSCGREHSRTVTITPFSDGMLIQPDSIYASRFDIVALIATVMSNNVPAADVPVTFNIRGFDGVSTVVKRTDSKGQAELVYSRSVSGHDTIRAEARVDGKVYVDEATVQWSTGGDGCGVEIAVTGAPDADAMLKMSHELRDEVLAKTARGKKYTQVYYQFAGEIVRLLLFNPRLLLRTRAALQNYQPVMQSLVHLEENRTSASNGGDVTITTGEIDDVDDLLMSLQRAGASQKLQDAIAEIRRDLRDQKVHSQFRIRVVAGPKRALTSTNQRYDFKLLGLASMSLLSFVGMGYRFARRTKKGSGNRFKRSVSLLLFCGIGPLAMTGCSSGNSHKQSGNQLSTSKATAPVPWESGKQSPIKMPITFEENRGQAEPHINFLSRGTDHTLLLSPTEATLVLNSRSPQRSDSATSINSLLPSPARCESPRSEAIRMRLIGSNATAQATGIDALPNRSSYFIGGEANKWKTDIPHYAKVRYEKVFPGVDLIYYGNQGQLEHDFNVAPGADPALIRFAFVGVEEIAIDSSGDLLLRASTYEIRQPRPIIYQEANGIRHEITGSYVIDGNNTVGFQVSSYDPTETLVIDPVLSYSTYLGGSGDDEGNTIAVDAAGNAYIIGFTDSLDFPLTNPRQPTYGGNPQDVFVAKLNLSGQLIYSTYLGGSGQDNGSAIAVDAEGNAYLAGFTGSANFPTVSALQPTKTGTFNAFIAKLNPTGSQLVFSTYLGGTAGEFASSIALDSAGNAYVGGVTTSTNFPTANPAQPTFGGDLADSFIAKLNPGGNQLVYSTYLGGKGNDGITGIALDPAGNLYATGVTSSTNFITVNPSQKSFGEGDFDAFVTKFNDTGNQIVYSTYIGGSRDDRGYRIATDIDGNAYVAGQTASNDFPIKNGLQGSHGGGTDAFVMKLDALGGITFSTYLGGSGIDGATSVVSDVSGNVYVTGFTDSTNFPTADSVQTVNRGNVDAFVSKLSASGSALSFSTYLGGTGRDAGFSIAVDSTGAAYVLGQTASDNFPTISPLQAQNAGGAFDLFIAKLKGSIAITSASVSGKMLIVNGGGFSAGAKIILNGEVQKKTANDEQNPATTLIAKKAGKMILRGQTVTLQVRNPDGLLSNEFSFTRPAN